MTRPGTEFFHNVQVAYSAAIAKCCCLWRVDLLSPISRRRGLCFKFSWLLVITAVISLMLNYHKFTFYNLLRITKTNERNQTPLCSFPVLMAAADDATGYIPATGNWTQSRNGLIEQFKPNICRLKYGDEWPVDVLSSCLTSSNFKNIVVLGDSNGVRFGAALLRFLARKDYACTEIANDHGSHNHDLSFYATDKTKLSDLRVNSKACGYCRNSFSTRTRCKKLQEVGGTTDTDVFVTYLHLIHTNGTLITSSHSKTSQEFMFQEYFKSVGNVPDLVLNFGTTHDMNHGSLSDFERAVDNFLDLMEQNLPAMTRVVWLSNPSFYPPHQPVLYRNRIYEEKYLTNQWIAQSNRVLFKKINERFKEKGRPLTFFDTFELINPIQSLINVDGIHLKPVWYDHVLSYIFQTFCADLLK